MPQHGAGAGFCIEDSAVLASLLEDESIKGVEDLEHVFATFDNARRERANWLVQSSRRAGDMYEYRSEHGDDVAKIGEEMKQRFAHIWSYDIRMAVEEARADLRLRLGHA
jgi:salicylate hydroxylase